MTRRITETELARHVVSWLEARENLAKARRRAAAKRKTPP